MKKGLILALLMVAMVAMVLPVSARAPIVNPLPTIIVGDADDDVTSGSVQVGIERYTDALNLLDPTKINWNNPPDVYTSASYHAYLLNPATGTPNPNVLPYDATGLIDLLTSTEYANIFAAGTQPAASARLTEPGAATQMLSLINATRHPGILDPMTASPAVDGVPLDSTSVNTTLLFVAAVEATESHKLSATDLGTTSTADSVSPLKVICQSSVSDSKLAPTTPVQNYGFEGSVEGWSYSTAAGYPAATQIGGTGQTGVGFNIASAPAGNVTHGSWASPATLSGTSQQQGRVYRAVAKLTTTATGTDTSPGWRLTFRNVGFSHYGKVNLDTTGAEPTGETNRVVAADTAGREARLYWVVPYFLGDMGDGGGQALNPGQDLRPYRVTFDAIATVGDAGQLIMQEIDISYILHPMDMDPVIAWGTDAGQTAYNVAAGSGGWKVAASNASIGYADGTRTINAGNFVLNISGTSGNRYAGATAQDFDVTTYPFLPVNQLRPVSNHLYRFSFEVSCASQATVPTYRCIINGWNRIPVAPPFNVSTVARKMAWMQFWAYSNVVQTGKQQYYIWPGQSATVCPGAPGTSTPTKLEMYVWSHSVAPQTSSLVSTLFPLVDLVDVGNFAVPGSLWQDPHGNMTFTSAQWEDLGSDW